MKTTSLILMLITFVADPVRAGELMVSNSKGFNSNPVLDNTGMALTGTDPVIVAVGTFASEPATLLSTPAQTLGSGVYASLLAEFSQSGPPVAFVDPVPPLNLLGVFDHQHDGPVAGTPLEGKPVYVIVAQGADLASATSVCIFRTTAIFDAAEDENALPKMVSVGLNHGTTLIAGSTGVYMASASNLDPTLEPAYSLVALSNEAPEIEVDYPIGTPLVDGAFTLGFGGVLIGSPNGAGVFTVRNTGDGELSGIGVVVDGPDAASFVVDTELLSNSLPPGGSGSFVVSMLDTGGASGSRSASLHITSNDTDENPFDIALEGLALSGVLDGDNDGLNDWAEYQFAPLGFNWQVAQPGLVETLNSGANAAGLFTPGQVRALHAGVPLISRNPVTGRFKLTLDWKKSTDLSGFFDFPAAPADVSVNGAGDIEFDFASPDNAAFFRLEAD